MYPYTNRTRMTLKFRQLKLAPKKHSLTGPCSSDPEWTTVKYCTQACTAVVRRTMNGCSDGVGGAPALDGRSACVRRTDGRRNRTWLHSYTNSLAFILCIDLCFEREQETQESFRGDEHKLKTRIKIQSAIFIHLMTLRNYRLRVV